MAAAADSSSSSSSRIRGSYDVFLSFRGFDTRKIFVGHLYNALQRKALATFIDTEELGKGDVLGVLLKAIDASKLSVVVLSENFAYSKWCLLELEKIVECMETKNHIVVPIFYQVDPADVRYVRGSFSKAFEQHEHKSRGTPEERKRWKSALTRAGYINGWDSRKYEDDVKLIDDVVKNILKQLSNIRESKSNDDLVGMDSHISNMKSLLSAYGSGDVCIVGIWGMGGIGKTTIARAVYEEMCGNFDHHCFLYNVKEDFKRKGEAGMQEELLYRISRENGQHLSSKMIMERLSGIKLLLVLDDVDSSDQIDALLGKQCSFGRGSRIIITTRDKGLLREFDVYEPGYLDEDQALELFKKYAFRTIEPLTEYDHLSQHAIKYAQGLPLALKVLGASLYKKSVREWEVEFEKIKKCQHLGIEGVLRTTFEGLDHLQKTVLLDIACFFKEMKKDYATEILEACGLFPISVLPVLVDRALVTSTGYYVVLTMHDLLLDMALGIVRRESSLSRLTSSDEIEEVLTQNTDTKAVESIDLDLYHSKGIRINAKAFVHMTKLRLLRIRYNRSIDFVDDYYGSRGELYHLIDDCKQQVSGELKFLSHELRCLIWHGCPLKSLPSNFNPKHLVDLDMRSSRIRQLWKGTKLLKKLKYIDLSLSLYLKETPDLTEATNLEKVNLEGCTSLLEVHPSISDLKNLAFLSLKGCKELKILPSSFCMKSLKTLELSGCSNLDKFPEISEVMAELPRLSLDKTAIKELPSSIKNLRGLVTLSLKDCRELESLPSSICELKSLRYVTLSGCSKFKVFPKIVGVEDMKGLIELHMDGTSIEEFLPPISALEELVVLSLRDCEQLKSLPSSIHMKSLDTLILSGCSNLQKFPEISEKMRRLSELHLDDIAIVELPLSIKNLCQLESLSLKDCGELKSLPSSIFELESLSMITVSGCSKFKVFPQNEEDLEGLQKLVTLRLEDCGELRSLPSCICQLKSLRFVALSGCSKFEVFPEILEDMDELRELHLDGTSIKNLSPSIERLKRIMLLNMRNCRSLIFLPENICNLSYLTGLTLSGCLNLHNLPKNLGKLESLVDLEVQGSGIEQPFSLLHPKKSPSSSANCLVGMDRHINKMQSLLCLDQVDDVRIVGICGIGGIGKTTIATAVYDKIAPQFEHHCFLENVKEGFIKHSAEQMQEELLTRILKVKVQSLSILNRGSNMLIERLGMKKVLVVLDDIDDITQIETLLEKPYSFGGGSRIIVTTRKEEIMSGFKIYRPQLSNVEAVELFRHFAFRTNKPSRGYGDLSRRATQHAQVPLDLKVWGAFLFNKSIHEWEDALTDKHTVYWVLTTHFYGLHYSERNILIDVAWFFEGMKKEYATKILHGCGLFPYSALRGLIDRSLISISERDGTIKMHDLLQGIVRDCVRHEDEHEPGNRSRLEGYQGIRCLSTQDQVTKAVEVITLDLSNSKEVYFIAEAFVTMKKLRLLQIYDNGSINCKQHVIGDFEFISHELRCLIWHRYPVKSLPSNFYPKNLVDLDMRFSRLELLWEGTKLLKYLTFINLSHSQYLKEIPDLSTAPNLEKLILDGCTSLFEVHPSIWNHKNLIFLSLKGCRQLEILPTNIHMKSLKTLNLSGCTNLEKFPEISEVMMELSELGLDETAIKKLPSSIERLQGLNVLSMRNCTSLVSLPDSICSLAHLTFLNLSGCSKLSDFPYSLRNNTQSLTISGLEELTFCMRNKEIESEISSDEFFSLSENSSESGEEVDGKEEKVEMGGGSAKG
ncbi:disease resistance protein RUN1-like isoform X1 [Rosa rugosa]|uniref:disease resistance protein RUN1-like isoform X1 n=1 Tax=Rosa rugosa TaxID=74645 RepID=UPI002B41427A|nr:disease resistance protein RUN1-like isoform X1 [Rosa rugosa]XP_061996247.1 disease resistance protein RUN1-like isoform X1 [Rosa rugosa]XP_061996248.1 disease resistance protein RUN1-like isoform X1 [Rosa rugosa]